MAVFAIFCMERLEPQIFALNVSGALDLEAFADTFLA